MRKQLTRESLQEGTEAGFSSVFHTGEEMLSDEGLVVLLKVPRY